MKTSYRSSAASSGGLTLIMATLVALLPAPVRAQPKPTGAPSAAAAEVKAVAHDEANVLFRKAIAAHDAGELTEAEGLFLKAWSLKKTWDIAANLGLVESRLGKHAAAAQHFAYAVRMVPPTEPSSTTAELSKRLESVRGEVSEIRILATVDGADVRVNGKRIGVSPLAEEVFVDAGMVTVEASATGYKPAKQTIEAKKGGTLNVKLTLAPIQKHEERSIVGPAIAFGVGGAGLVTGAIAGGVAAAKFGEIKSACGEALICPESARGTYDAGNTTSHLSTASFIVAGVGAAVGVTLLLLPTKNKTSERMAVSVGPSFVSVKGSF